MTGNDLLVLVPWAIFGAGLALIYLWLRRSRWSSPPPGPPPPHQPEPGARRGSAPPSAQGATGRCHHRTRP